MSLTIEDFKKIYLVDKVTEEDKFHHQDFADILWRIINGNVPPFNVGIFGKWGVGKSTIVHLFEKKIEEWNKSNPIKYKFIEFKVWKFSKDALKNKFIFTIGRKLDPDRIEELTAAIRSKRTEFYSLINAPGYLLKEFFSLKNFPLKFAIKSTVVCTILIGLFFAVDSILNLKLVQTISDWLVITITYLAFLTPSLYKTLGNVLNKKRWEVTFDKYDSEEQFEEKFIEIVKKDKSIKVIFIDDLDRCNEDKVIETLETIKTYLEVETCIFIIACDDDVVRNIVATKRKELCNKLGDSASYLNKFFQYSIRITPFFHQNMKEYAKEILETQKNDLLKLMGELDEILYVLIHDEVKSPRKVIALLNNFASDFELILKREKAKILQAGDVSEKLPALAVFTVLKTDYPDFYQLLIKDTSLFKYIFEIEKGQLEFERYQKDIIKKIYRDYIGKEFVDEEAKNFVNFIIRVDDIIRDIDDINLFIYLNRDQSTGALESDRFRKLQNFVKGGNCKGVKEMIDGLETDNNKIHHFNVIRNILVELTYKQEIKKGLQCLFDVIEKIPNPENNIKSIAWVAMNKMLSVASDKAKWVEDFNLDGIFFTLQYLGATSRTKEIIRFIIGSLSTTSNRDFADRILKAIFKYENLIEEQDTLTTQQLLDFLNQRTPKDDKTTTINLSLKELCEYIAEFKDKKAAVQRFFSTGIANEICERIIQLDLKNEQDDKEKEEYSRLEQAINIIDSSLSDKINRQIEIYIKLLSAHKFYSKMIEKIESIKQAIPEIMAESLVEALCKKTESVSGNDFMKLLELIDEISRLIVNRPIKSFTVLQSSLPQILANNPGIMDFVFDYFVRFSDGRFSEEGIEVIASTLLDNIKISKEMDKTRKISDFLLKNLQLLNVKNRNKFWDIAIREIFDVETYTKVTNNEGINYWKVIYPNVYAIAEEKDKIFSAINLNSSVLAENRSELTLEQKNILAELLLRNFDDYTFANQLLILNLFLSYLKSAKKENTVWGVDKASLIIAKIPKDKFTDDLKEQICIPFDYTLVNCEDRETHIKTLEILLGLKDRLVNMGDTYKNNLLLKIENEFGAEGNHDLAIRGFKELFPYYSNEKQVQICGIYLGISENTKELIERIAAEFAKLPQSAEADYSISPRIMFIEKYISGVHLDRNAWTFFAELAKKLKENLNLDEKKYLIAENFRKIKAEVEKPGITRNRFTLINNHKGEKLFSELDIFQMFTSLFNSDSMEKVEIGVDCFYTYYPNFQRISRKDRGTYKGILEKTAERIEVSEDLKKKLRDLSRKLW